MPKEGDFYTMLAAFTGGPIYRWSVAQDIWVRDDLYKSPTPATRQMARADQRRHEKKRDQKKRRIERARSETAETDEMELPELAPEYLRP